MRVEDSTRMTTLPASRRAWERKITRSRCACSTPRTRPSISPPSTPSLRGPLWRRVIPQWGRTWQLVFDTLLKTKAGMTTGTRERYERAVKETALDSLRQLPLLQTRAEHLLQVLERETVSTNMFLRRLHSFALTLDWLPWPVLGYRQWLPHPLQGTTRRDVGGTPEFTSTISGGSAGMRHPLVPALPVPLCFTRRTCRTSSRSPASGA